MTQVRSTTGQVRKVRRLPQAAYPMVRLTQAEIASMLHRKQERIRERAAEVTYLCSLLDVLKKISTEKLRKIHTHIFIVIIS